SRSRARLDARAWAWRLSVCAPGRLRFGRGHTLRIRARSGFAQPGHELDRAHLGRERNLAGARRACAYGGFPARICDHHPSGLFPDRHHAAGAHFSWGCVRIPLPRRRASDLLRSRLQLWVRPWRFRAGRCPRRIHSGLSDGRSPLHGRLIRLLYTVFAAHWRRPGLRLQPARRGLADLEDRRRASGLGAGAGPPRVDRRSDRHRPCEPVDAVGEAGDRRAVVCLAPYCDSGAGADRHGADRLLGVAVAQQPLRGGAVHRRNPIVRDVLPRPRDQPLSADRAVQIHPMGRGVLAIDAGLFARGHGVPAAGHPHVLRLVLLGVSRQGPRRPRLSLTEPLALRILRLEGAGSGEAPAARFTHAAGANKAHALYGTTSTILRVVGSTSTGILSTTVYWYCVTPYSRGTG